MPREAPPPMKLDYGTLLTAIAANDTEANRTATIDCSRVSEVTVVIGLARSAATALTMIMKSSTNAVLYGREQSIAAVGGTGTLSDFTWTKTVSGDVVITLKIPTLSFTGLQLIFGATGGGASDKITVTGMGGAGA